MSPFSDVMNEYSVYKDAIKSKNGSLLGGFKLSGVEPDATTLESRKQLTLSMANFMESLPDNINCSQYYIKLNGFNIKMKEREDPLSSLLSVRREAYINTTNLSETKLFHFFESKKDEIEDLINSVSTLKDFASLPFSSSAREKMKNRLTTKGHFVESLKTLESTHEILNTALDEGIEFYQTQMQVERLSTNEIKHFLGFLCSLDKYYFNNDKFDSDHIIDGLPNSIPDSSITSHNYGGVNMIKFQGSEIKYARIISLSEYITERIKPGFIVSNILNPLMIDGSFILINRYKPISELLKPEYFRRKSIALDQMNIKPMDLLKGNEKLSDVDRQKLESESTRKRKKEIDVEQNLDAKHGFINSHVLLFGDTPDEVNDTAKQMVSALSRIGARYVYEDSLRQGSYASFFPCSSNLSDRDLKSNTGQFSASSLMFKPSIGKTVIEDYGNEEYLYPFKSKDGTPFYYSPFVNGRGLVLMIGPIRSGKSFFRKTIATHFMKYDGFLRMVDPDPGSEKIAKVFGDKGGVFKIDPDQKLGFNLFSTCLGKNDTQFHEHFLWIIDYLLSLNASKEMQELTREEQIELDRWIKKVMSYDKKKRSFFSLYNHCSRPLKEKLSRFVRGGVYGDICDCDEDAVSGIDKMVAAFNVLGVKDMKQMFPFVMYEIFFRIRRLFENKKYRTIAKLADIDEAHIFLKIPGVMEMLSENVRTWGKWLASLCLTTQSPQELFDMKDWSMFRSSASTYVFFADPKIDLELYQKAFLLSESEMMHIARLKPRKEAYIIQREINVSKTIVIDVENEQYVINTSKATEEQMTLDNIEKYGHVEGINKSLKELGLEPTEVV